MREIAAAAMVGIVDSSERTQALQHSSELTPQTPRMKIRRKLTALGSARKEQLSDLDLLTYSKGLDDLSLDDLDEVIRGLSLGERGQYEEKIPALGDLRGMVVRVGWKRRREAREAAESASAEAYRKIVEAERREDRERRDAAPGADVLSVMLGKAGQSMSMDRDVARAIVPVPEVPCSHCQMLERMMSSPSKVLRRMEAVYRRRAEEAELREAMVIEVVPV